ncbi:hypothetical protein [Calidifontibacillus erzurumensis]|uniref:Uncharacterized protein n=1 Tax=Calidifontibacillus erzurumensis TaxID=2741433 RepID=A0A8J8GEJ7_9BACI|nr:hypothetical protein [Calidifontibacillus erzurumensis]NSL51716.1 hypothetical protein [Calidifontibacillus erzurumensis]
MFGTLSKGSLVVYDTDFEGSYFEWYFDIYFITDELALVIDEESKTVFMDIVEPSWLFPGYYETIEGMAEFCYDRSPQETYKEISAYLNEMAEGLRLVIDSMSLEIRQAR